MEESKRKRVINDSNGSSQEDLEDYNDGAEFALSKAKKVLELTEKSRDNKLDFEDFGLHDIVFITNERRLTRWEFIVELNLSRNNLFNIDQVSSALSSLAVLRASQNYLTQVTLSLPALEQLHIDNNQIAYFPLLNALPKLRVLNLNGN
jgi:Leucine-rich repeat (LRR) protein